VTHDSARHEGIRSLAIHGTPATGQYRPNRPCSMMTIRRALTLRRRSEGFAVRDVARADTGSRRQRLNKLRPAQRIWSRAAARREQPYPGARRIPASNRHPPHRAFVPGVAVHCWAMSSGVAGRSAALIHLEWRSRRPFQSRWARSHTGHDHPALRRRRRLVGRQDR
jgi:hypothetical protein